MSELSPISAEQLRANPEITKKRHIEHSITDIYYEIKRRSCNDEKKTSCFIQYPVQGGATVCYSHGQYQPTIEDMVNRLKELFIDCKVEYVTQWIEVTKGTKQEKKGFLVDWSEQE